MIKPVEQHRRYLPHYQEEERCYSITWRREGSLAQGSTGVDLSWTAVDGAGTYKVYGSDDPYAAEPWDLVATVTSPAYTYTGTEANKFFKVVAENGLIISRASHTKLDNIRTNRKVRLQEQNINGKRK
ncbi:MAG: hypothetical protein M0Q99_12110 [Candidatus Cloacimonetes bacterium]|jgi:hypothetical protein|nr:hypothetical protein [Candidatus Cloacimonadota bacterium]